VKVVLAVNGLGLGGTEKAVQTHALAFDRGVVDVSVVAVREDGFRREALETAGIGVACAAGDPRRLRDLFAGADVVHVTRAGVAEHLVPEAVAAAGVPVLVESNVFGAVDASADERRFSAHLFPSKMCAWRYRTRLGLEGPDFHERHKVSFWPVDIARLRELAPEPREAKERLGLDPDRPVVMRVGRANDRKWRDLIVDMVPPLLERSPDAQVVFVGATPAKLRRLDGLGVLEQTLLLPPTADEGELAAFYAAADVFVTAAEIGESHSFAIEEAMCLGVPVVTCSTPWVDNAQIEQVDNGATGWLADHPLPFAESIAALLADPDLRARFSAAARAKSDALYGAGPLTRQLERLYAYLLGEQAELGEWLITPGELDAFGAEYERRLGEQFRALSESELGESRGAYRRERGRWAARAARESLNPDGLRYAASVVRARLPRGAG
jgi:glycosyltransferase involved in cell wall biosynthesis